MSKLSEARIIVDKLKSQASQQTVLLREKQAEADTALDLITNSMQVSDDILNIKITTNQEFMLIQIIMIKSAGDQKIEMESLREQTMKENEKLSKRKKEIDAELSEIEPLVQEGNALS